MFQNDQYIATLSSSAMISYLQQQRSTSNPMFFFVFYADSR